VGTHPPDAGGTGDPPFEEERMRKTRFLAFAALIAVMSLVASPAMADPPGNNGTVKIDDKPFDTAPDNEPHVGCTFQVDFYGYDKGDYWADVTFALQPPSGTTTLLTSSVFIGGDEAGGGTDVDAQRQYNIQKELETYGVAHPIQGYHVKLTVNAPGSIGADVKHKVFWVKDCLYGYGN
jgi:hypothetical protein